MDEQPRQFYVTVRYWVNRDGKMSRVGLAGAFSSWVSEANATYWARCEQAGKSSNLRVEVWTLTGDQMAGLMRFGWKRGALFQAKCQELGIPL